MTKRVNRNDLPKLTKSEWSKRRFRLDLSLIFIALMIGWIILSGKDTAVYQQAIIALIAAGVTLVGQYIFGAAWDDKNYMRTVADMHKTQFENSGDNTDDSAYTPNDETEPHILTGPAMPMPTDEGK